MPASSSHVRGVRQSHRRVGASKIAVVVAPGGRGWGDVARQCLEADDAVDVVVEAANGDPAAVPARARGPVVVVVDRGIVEARPHPVLPSARRPRRRARVLAVAREPDDAFALDVVKRGGHGVLPEDSLPLQLLKAVRCVAAGEVWLSRVQEGFVLETLWRLVRERRTGAEPVGAAERAPRAGSLRPRVDPLSS